MSSLSLISALPQITNFELNNEEIFIKGFCETVGDILTHPRFNEMREYHHHKEIDCHFHSVFVAYLTYKICRFTSCNTEEATRAAILHDFYLYDWHITKHDELHAWYHPKQAKINAEKYFGSLTPKQEDMILAHMWPLHLMPPRSKEGMVLTMADKICTNLDLMKLSEKFLPIYHEIDKEMHINE